MFQNALDFLNGKTRRKIKANTYLEVLDDNTLGVLYHQTYILKINKDQTFTLNTGGWNTVTTRERMRRAIALFNPMSKNYVFTKKGELFFQETAKQAVEFFDGMIVSATTGRCVNYWNRG
jgi:hypothetical protein